MRRDLLYLDLALENVVRAAAERGAGAAGSGAGALVGPLLQNLVLSVGDNEELCYCLKAWQALPPAVTAGAFPSREDALKVGLGLGSKPASTQKLKENLVLVHRVRAYGEQAHCHLP